MGAGKDWEKYTYIYHCFKQPEESRTMRSKRWEQAQCAKCEVVRGQEVAPFLTAPRRDQELDPLLVLLNRNSVDPAGDNDKRENGSTSSALQSRTKKKKKSRCTVRNSALRTAALTGVRRRRHLDNAAHPQVGLTKSLCWSNKSEVAVWLSLFSAERSVSNKHCHSWLQPQEAASNPEQEFNPKRLVCLNAGGKKKKNNSRNTLFLYIYKDVGAKLKYRAGLLLFV